MIDIHIKESEVAKGYFNIIGQNNSGGHNFPPCQSWQVMAIVSQLVNNGILLSVQEICGDVADETPNTIKS